MIEQPVEYAARTGMPVAVQNMLRQLPGFFAVAAVDRALRLVAIDRIPFPVPTDPLVQARSRLIESRGESSFRGYMLPRAAMILKQGFGRLLRTRDDRGVVALLDRRVAKSGYGRTLLAGLPDARRTRLLQDVIAFWQRHEQA